MFSMVSGFVPAAARIACQHGASFEPGPRFRSCLRHTAVHNTSLVPTPGTGRYVSWGFRGRCGTALRYVATHA